MSLGVQYFYNEGLPQWLKGKETVCSAGDTRDVGSIPGSERSPREGSSNPLQYSCLGNPTDRGAWQATDREVIKESATT